MLKKSNQMKLSAYKSLYDHLIPKDNFLRQVKEEINFEFVNRLLKESYCENFGRPAKEPEMMFKLLFLKRFYDLSDVELVNRATFDMSFKYFLDLVPEEKVIDPSLLTKFRKSRINNESILEEMLHEILKQAIEKGIVKSNSIIVDSTHSKSKGLKETPTQMLRRKTKELRKEIYMNAPELAEQFPEKPEEKSLLEDEIVYTNELLEITKELVSSSENSKLIKKWTAIQELLENDKIREIQSIIDNDAKQGYKSEENSFFGYKSHIAITEERLITAIEVTNGSAPDGKFLPNLIEKSKNNGIAVKEVIGDTAYSGKDNLEYSDDIEIISKLHPIISNANCIERNGFEFNKDANMMVCPAGIIAKRKAITGKKNNTNLNQSITYYFDVEECKKCPLRDGCYTPEAKSKTYSTNLLSDTHKRHKDFQETEYFKARMKERYMIEAKNAELKQAHGLDKCIYVGLIGMKIQSYFSAFATNIKRIIKISRRKLA